MKDTTISLSYNQNEGKELGLWPSLVPKKKEKETTQFMMFETKECWSTTSTIHTARSTIFFNSSDFEISTEITWMGKRSNATIYVCSRSHT